MMTNLIASLLLGANVSCDVDIARLSRQEWDVVFHNYSLTIPTNAMTVTVSTNVVKVSNAFQKCSICEFCVDAGMMFHEHNTRGGLTEPTERAEVTIVTERRVLRVKWFEEWRELVSEKELSRTVKRWVKKEVWEEGKK